MILKSYTKIWQEELPGKKNSDQHIQTITLRAHLHIQILKVNDKSMSLRLCKNATVLGPVPPPEHDVLSGGGGSQGYVLL